MMHTANPKAAKGTEPKHTIRGRETRAIGSHIAPPQYGIDFVDQQNRAGSQEKTEVESEGRHQTPARYKRSGPPPGRTGLPEALQAGIENLSGQSLEDVRVYYNSSRPAAIEARAYTQGNNIYVGRGQEQQLPHEAWHVVQQRQGRVPKTGPDNVGVINLDEGLEQEAEVMGRKATAKTVMPPWRAARPTRADGRGGSRARDRQTEPGRNRDIGRTVVRHGTTGAGIQMAPKWEIWKRLPWLYPLFVGKNLNDQRRIKNDPSLVEGKTNRLRAVQELRQYEDNTVGGVARPLVRVWHALTGNFGGRDIGGHYHENKDRLSRKATDAALRDFAEIESGWWGSTDRRWLDRQMGGVIGPTGRFNLLRVSRDWWPALKDWLIRGGR